jgi:hypothetical protein
VNRTHRTFVVLTVLAVSFSTGCGGTSNGASSPIDVPTDAPLNVSGSFDLILTSANGRGKTYIYTNFIQTETTFTGTPTALVCPSNDLSQCVGDQSSAGSIIPIGTISGKNVTIVVSFPTAAGADTVTMTGVLTGTDLGGTFLDSLGDAGNWSAYRFNPYPNFYNFSGTFNSTSNPLPIAPTILAQLGQGIIMQGNATVLNSPCISSLNFTGEALGEAFSLTDAASKVRVIILPTTPAEGTFAFSYKFDPSAPGCPGDAGRGELTNMSAWE